MMARSDGFRDVARVCLNAVITFATLVPVLYVAIQNDIEGLLAEILVQAVVVAGIIAKIMRIPQVESWLESIGIGRLPTPADPTPPQPPAAA